MENAIKLGRTWLLVRGDIVLVWPVKGDAASNESSAVEIPLSVLDSWAVRAYRSEIFTQ